MTHRTQFPDEIERISKLTDEQIEKLMSDPNTGWWSEPLTLIFGKSVVGGAATDDVFANIKTGELIRRAPASRQNERDARQQTELILGGPWQFYADFRAAHGLENLLQAAYAADRSESGLDADPTAGDPSHRCCIRVM